MTLDSGDIVSKVRYVNFHLLKITDAGQWGHCKQSSLCKLSSSYNYCVKIFFSGEGGYTS